MVVVFMYYNHTCPLILGLFCMMHKSSYSSHANADTCQSGICFQIPISVHKSVVLISNDDFCSPPAS